MSLRHFVKHANNLLIVQRARFLHWSHCDRSPEPKPCRRIRPNQSLLVRCRQQRLHGSDSQPNRVAGEPSLSTFRGVRLDMLRRNRGEWDPTEVRDRTRGSGRLPSSSSPRSRR